MEFQKNLIQSFKEEHKYFCKEISEHYEIHNFYPKF